MFVKTMTERNIKTTSTSAKKMSLKRIKLEVFNQSLIHFYASEQKFQFAYLKCKKIIQLIENNIYYLFQQKKFYTIAKIKKNCLQTCVAN